MQHRCPAELRRGPSFHVLAVVFAAFALLALSSAAAGVAGAAPGAAGAGVRPAPAERRAGPTVDPSGPTVKLTAPSISCASSAKTSFKVSWAASPALPAGGFDAYRVEYREPGVDYWLIWQKATAARSATFAAQAGHAYEFRAAAAKSADQSVVGPWSAVRPVAVPADDASFKVTNKWTSAKASGAYLGKLRASTAKGATATCAFKGTRISLVAPRGRAYGKVAAYVRSRSGTKWSAFKLIKTVDLYAKSTRARVVTTLASYPSATQERQVRLVVTGKKNRRSRGAKVAIDGLAVRGAPHATGAYQVNVTPANPSVVVAQQIQFTAGIPGCADQSLEWSVYRTDRFGAWHTDEAGSITPGGLYTAPSLPTKTVADAGDDHRQYWVKAVAAANPDELVRLVQVTVDPLPAPTITSISPLSVPEGGAVTITGTGFSDPSGAPQVFFSTIEATVTSHSDTRITAVAPGGWQAGQTEVTVTVRVVTREQTAFAPDHVTITDLDTPPSVTYVNPYPYEMDGSPDASPGDTLYIEGWGFSPEATGNQVRFAGGSVVTEGAYTAKPWVGANYGVLSVIVPDGAQTGLLQVRRIGTDWSAGVTVTINPATVVTAGLHQSFNGIVTAPQLVSNGTWGNEEWLLQGSGFSKLRIANYSETTPGVFWLDIRRNGVTKTRIMRAVSDTLAVPHRGWGEQLMFPDELFADAQPGDSVELRVRGDELTNRYERASAWFLVTLGERPYWGSIDLLPSKDFVAWWGPSYTIARGSWLRITGSGATQQLTAPGLWSGTLPLGADGIALKLVPLTTNGTYTITNQTSGESTQLVVADVGKFSTWSYGSDTQTDLHTVGVRMRFAGGEITVPPGAFSTDDLGPYTTYFSLQVSHDPSDAMPWDPVITDGGRTFSVRVTPNVTRLLKPITVTVPYDTAGRTTVPFLGMWDHSSALYYDFRLSGAQIDTVNHKLTYTIPAGEYVDPAAKRSPAAKGSAVSTPEGAAALRAAAPSGLTFNEAFRKVGAVSHKVPTSGQDFVWHSPRDVSWGIRVDAVTDPTSTSYVSPEKAQQVLDVAVATWKNLVGKGWREPEAMITLTVRDYGDPGVYQGATTKGVFGQPWVYVNSRLTAGVRMATAVSHEMGHVFQRQLTTNLGTTWVDEAVAEWVAWDTLGAACDLQASFEYGSDFPTAPFPDGFWWGYTPEQAYGAGAFIIWLADTYGPTAVLNIYDTLTLRPDYWYDARATFLAATGRGVPQLVGEFATEFWLQTYDPIRAYTWSSRVIDRIPDYTGKTVPLSMGADSSLGLAFGPTFEFAATLTGKPMVALASGLPDGAVLDVYRDSTGASAPPSAPVKIGTISSLTPVLDLGSYAGDCYRVVAVTPAGAGLSASLTVEAVRLLSLVPASAPKGGGATITLSGCGFGIRKGTVMVGPAVVDQGNISTWTDTKIVFTMPNMGTSTGAQAVLVQPLVGGPANTLDLTVI
ncbi:MAG: hypothetical protein GX624_09455 [Actinobacteria bacterium]|nr:hypothetical protein [Actinomycetota bacterium]